MKAYFLTSGNPKPDVLKVKENFLKHFQSMKEVENLQSATYIVGLEFEGMLDLVKGDCMPDDVNFIGGAVWKHNERKQNAQVLASRTNIIMMDFYVCLSGIPWFQNQTIRFLLKLMGAKVLDAYTSHVTHLVTTKSGSHKFNVNSKYKLPCINPDWVWECFSTCTLVPLEPYEVKLFTGFKISCTSIPVEEKNRIQCQVLSNGGEYCKGLNATCTHLIAGSNQGKKYEHAIKWKLQVVNRRWFYDYIENFGLAKESDYPFNPNEEERNGSFKRTLKTENVERILEEGTMDLGDTDEEGPAQPSVVYEEEYDTLLDPFIIYIWDIKKSRATRLRDIIRVFGGTRVPSYSACWTNIVISDDPELAMSTFQAPTTCEVLVPEWLFDCYQEKKVVGFEKYRIPSKDIVKSKPSRVMNIDAGTKRSEFKGN